MIEEESKKIGTTDVISNFSKQKINPTGEKIE